MYILHYIYDLDKNQGTERKIIAKGEGCIAPIKGGTMIKTYFFI